MDKTAVEYLNERFAYIKWMRDCDEISIETEIKWYGNALERAKAMEKKQIIEAYKSGFSEGTCFGSFSDDTKFVTPEKYYSETYGEYPTTG